MTKEEANKILSGYVKACNEDDFHALEMFEYKEVIEAMTMGARALSTLSLPSSLDDAAVKKARDIFESLDKHDVGEEKNRVLFGLLELEALALTFSHFGAEWKTGQEEEYGPYARQYPKSKVSQEQPEVDLEKFTEKVKTFQARYKHPESISVKGAMAFMARMFYQYPNVARQWYEQLPKATMD